MSFFFFKRVLANPVRVGYIVPSSPFLTHMTARLINYSKARTLVELGPGEGCHTRRIVRSMTPDTRLLLLELDDHFVRHLTAQFAHDPRVTVVHGDAMHLSEILSRHGAAEPDYIVSGIPFTIMGRELREKLLGNIALAMGPATRIITYQTSVLISEHRHFELVRRKHCLLNVPPIHILELRKADTAASLAAVLG